MMQARRVQKHSYWRVVKLAAVEYVSSSEWQDISSFSVHEKSRLLGHHKASAAAATRGYVIPAA